jgi:predicted AlkP superfamily phosphohydrolase/phosphomutase
MAEVVPWPPLPGAQHAIERLIGKANKPAWAKASGLAWMPATRYHAFWPEMPAFALPAYYDAQIRLNVAGREAQGKVPVEHYAEARAEIMALLEACTDPATGMKAVASIYLPEKPPLELHETEADIYVSFAPYLFALDHPTLGQIGPYPFRRTGGHSGEWGFLWVAGKETGAGERGVASSFDVAPTVLDWLGERRPAKMSGGSLMGRLRPPSASPEGRPSGRAGSQRAAG